MKSLMSVALVVLAPTLGLACAAAGDQAGAVELTNPGSDATGEYWTPERLQGARPLPLPYPPGPPPGSAAADGEPADGQGSVSEPGGLGTGGVAPDKSNYLFPSDLLPKTAPAPK